MNSLYSLIDINQISHQKERKSDFVGADGLLYCGRCGTAKQYRSEIDGGKIHNCICFCQEERIKQREEQDIARQKYHKLRQLKANSLMDRKFYESTFSNFRQTKANMRQFQFAKRYAEHFAEMMARNQGLLLYGDVGTGKTYLAACIANYLMGKLVPVIMTSFVKILRDTQGVGGNYGDEEQLMRHLNTAKLLVIDDLGAERDTDYALEKVYGMIDSRYRVKKPMILTTNLTVEQMKVATDIRYTRIYDRIFEVCYPIKCMGKSFRKMEGAIRFDKMTRFLESGELED